MLKGGIIGFGGVGQNLTNVIRQYFDDADIVAVCNRSQGKLDIARDQFGITQLTHDPEELCSWDLDFVMVLSNNYAHREHVELAARHGKHIFCEKPIATSIEDADAMIRAVEKAGVVNSVNYSLRFIPAYIKLRELYQSGALGDLLSISCLRLRGYGLYESGVRHPAIVRIEESGGWVVHHACHAIDFIYWTAGELADVYARTESTAPAGPELVWGLCAMKEGGTGIVTDSVCGAREHYATIIGTKATAILHGEGKTQIVVTKETDQPDARAQETYEVEDYKYNQESLAHFFDCIKTGKQSKSTIRDARHSLAAACCMLESAETGLPVKVPAVQA